MKICMRCVLPETFPGILFDDRGVCQYCVQAERRGPEETAGTRERYAAKFMGLAARLRGKGAYDALLAFSGGKDSTYTLRYLRRRVGLSVLALTFDQGYVSPRAKENIRSVTDALGVDHIYFSPPRGRMIEAFRRSVTGNPYPPKALERASAVCNTCMNLAKSILLRTAIEMEVPFIAFGWSPGQAPVQSSVMRLNPAMIRQTQEEMARTLSVVMGEASRPYLLAERHYRLLDAARERFGEPVPYNVHPLAFQDYEEEKILNEIADMGWIPPDDTDGNSSNCLLNSFANLAHLEATGYHPYAFEIAALVRQGCMGRPEGLAKLRDLGDTGLAERIRGEFGLGGGK